MIFHLLLGRENMGHDSLQDHKYRWEEGILKLKAIIVNALNRVDSVKDTQGRAGGSKTEGDDLNLHLILAKDPAQIQFPIPISN